MKQGEENAKFIKNSNNDSTNYILQKNKKTRVGTFIIITVLVLILVAIIMSAFYFAE